MMISDIAALLTGEGLFTKYTGSPALAACASRDEIARLAYCFYDLRGRQDGRDVDDWLAAEQQLRRRYRQPR